METAGEGSTIKPNYLPIDLNRSQSAKCGGGVAEQVR